MTEVNFLVKKGLTVPKGSASTPSVIFDASDPNTGLYSPGADQVAVATNGSGRLFVDASGNVGIANSSPTNARLLVGDDLGAITTAARMVQVGHPSGGMLILGKDNTDYSYFTHEASTQTSNWFYRGGAGITLNSAGLVGIGTSSPSYKLHVVTDAISGRQDPTNISRTSGNLIRFTNPQFSTDASMGLLLRVFPDADSRQGAGIIANGGTNNGSTTLDLFYTDTAGTSKSGLRISDTGAVGIGTTSASTILDIVGAGNPTLTIRGSDGAYSGFVNIQSAAGGSSVINATGGANALTFQTNSTERARIDSSGRLLVGTSSSSDFARLVLQGYSADATGASILAMKRGSAAATLTSAGYDLGVLDFMSSDSGLGARIKAVVDGAWSSTSDCPTRLEFSTTADGASSPTERMRIDSTGRITGSTGGLEISRTVDSAAAVGSFISSSATTGNQYGLYVRLDGDPNNTGQYFLECYGGIDRRATIRSNGGLANYQSNNVDLSDQRTKRNIVPASSSWDCVQALEVVNFNYLDDDAGEAPRVGVIAQQVQQHCPEVVIPYQEAEDAVFDEDGNVVTPAMEERLGVREQQIMWMAIKALQEAQVRIEVLEAEVAALRAQ
jgi:hypothetical protein